MHLEIVTPEHKVFSGEVVSVQLPGNEGLFQVLNNHAPIISTLTKGSVKVEFSTVQVPKKMNKEKTKTVRLSQNFLPSEFSKNSISKYGVTLALKDAL